MTNFIFNFIPTGDDNFQSDTAFEAPVDLDDKIVSISNTFKERLGDIRNLEHTVVYGDSCDRLVISVKFDVYWNDYDGLERFGHEEWDVYASQSDIRTFYQELEEVKLNAEYI